MDRWINTFVLAFAILESTSYYAVASSLKVKMPEKCTGLKFCVHKHEDYPDLIIENLLKDSKELYLEYSEDLAPRIGPEEDAIPKDECPSTPHMDPIYEIVDNEGNIRFVVQSERLKQIIRIEQCDEPGPLTRGTRNLSDDLLSTVPLECKECTMNYKFLVLGLDGESFEAVAVKDGLPVCCSCRNEEAN